MEQHHFIFEDVQKAKRFVERLAHYLKDVAIYRDELEVYVIDDGPKSQHELIYRFAKASSASFAIKLDVT